MNYLLNATIIAIIFAILKLIHIKFVLKEKIIPKPIIVDSILVFISVIIILYSIDKFNLDQLTSTSKNIQAFINNPDF